MSSLTFVDRAGNELVRFPEQVYADLLLVGNQHRAKEALTYVKKCTFAPDTLLAEFLHSLKKTTNKATSKDLQAAVLAYAVGAKLRG